MFRSLLSPGSTLAILACCWLVFIPRVFAQNPPPSTPPPQTAAPAASPDTTAKPTVASSEQDVKEVSSQDTPATFKVRVNNVLVRVVVRDSHGKVVQNLKKEDFQLYDGRKLP